MPVKVIAPRIIAADQAEGGGSGVKARPLLAGLDDPTDPEQVPDALCLIKLPAQERATS